MSWRITGFVPSNMGEKQSHLVSVRNHIQSLPQHDPMSSVAVGTPCLRASAAVSDKENTCIAVVAPVPLPHAARSKAALRTMMSFGEEGKGQPAQELARIHLCDDMAENILTSAPEGSHLLSADVIDTRRHVPTSQMVIRPISASTLMALTEPCLMAWCDFPNEDMAVPDHSAVDFPPKASAQTFHANSKNMASSVCNSWGY
ncbi:hypothetical protein B0H34DRAFT_796164 [Crassisporium funariophilum]|nr:hypothetical protein B0H34DRAFT_796164 [Crassisporium funariophilum]